MRFLQQRNEANMSLLIMLASSLALQAVCGKKRTFFHLTRKSKHVLIISVISVFSGRAGYFITFWKNAAGEYWGWRILILFQILPALIFTAMLPSMPETYISCLHWRGTKL